MEKGVDIPMRGPGYYDAHVKWTQRLTYDGEYLHAAPWNCAGGPGCTGPAAQHRVGRHLQRLHQLAPRGCGKALRLPRGRRRFVQYPNANGGKMQFGQGYGDWNVPWVVWQTGEVIRPADQRHRVAFGFVAAVAPVIWNWP